MSISTLKTAKVGDKVTMLTFTGMNLGQFEITKAGKTKVALMKKDGTQAEFNRADGIQTNATNPKYANKIVDPIAEPEKKVPVKKAAAPAKAEEVEEVEEAPKATKAEKKAPKAAKPAKKVEKVEIEEDAEDFDDEEDLDDDFEEFDEE